MAQVHSLLAIIAALCAAGDQTFVVQSQSLNKYVAVLDGQWQGIRVASDGNCYFGSSTHAHNHGAAFVRYEPRTQMLTMLAEDLSRICGEEPPQDIPQGKLHSDIVEHAGWLYFATHLGFYTPEGKSRYTGAHVLGCELVTGKFRDFGVVRPGYSCYSGIGVDPRRNCLYVFVTTFNAGGETSPASHLYRIDIATGHKKDLGAVKAGGPHHCFWFFIDQRGDCWFTLGADTGSLYCLRGQTDRIERFEDVLPERAVGPDRWWHWAQPLPGQDKVIFTLYNGDGLWTFDPQRWAADRGTAFERIADIGYSYLGLAATKERVYYVQRAGRQKGHQDVNDHHLLSVSLGPAPQITDHGLIVDQDGRRAYRIPSLAADDSGRVFLVGDWYVLPGEKGSYRHQRGEQYQYIERGQSFAVGQVPGRP